jgi:uncharacterized cupin superfamily protein
MTDIHNVDSISDDYTSDPRFQTGLMTIFLGALGGSENIYVNIDYVKPGVKSVKYHSHSIQEEFFLILKGSGALRLNDRTVSVRQGDFFSKPAGKGIAHQFINTGDEVLEILDCGTLNENDIVSYPDEDVILIKETGMAFRNTDRIEGWSSEPDN